MRLSDYVIDFLKKENLTHGFFMIGGSIGYLADSCATKGFTLYTMHHEQAAAFAAEAQAITTRGMGFATATSGPGATNLITGIASSYFASIPVIFITGQVNTFESNQGDRRQVGFQETDIISMVTGVTKYCIQIRDPTRMRYELEKSIFLAKNGRMGPVLIDLPLDMQRAEIEPERCESFTDSEEFRNLTRKKELDHKILKNIAKLIQEAQRPIVLLGHGVRLSNAEQIVLDFVTKTNMPVVVSLLGTDVFPHDNPLFYGFIGTYAERFSNLAVANSDLILVLGARLDSRQIGVQSKEFAPMAKIIHVDIDISELGASVKEHISVKSDIKVFLGHLIPFLNQPISRQDWIKHLNWLKEHHGPTKQKIGETEIDPIHAVSLLSNLAKEDEIICVDVGSNQMWFARGWKVKLGQSILTNGGMAPMGYALPAAIGASLSHNRCPVIAVIGDGGMQVNIQELQTVVRNKLPIKIVILNNNALGMLTQFQSENFGARLIGSVDGYDSPDFVKIAKAYGLAADTVSKNSQLEDKLTWLMNHKDAVLLDIRIPVSYWVLPKSRFSSPVHDMSPHLDREDLKKALKYVTDKKD